MMLLWKGLLLAAGSYLLGSVSASILISRTMLGSDVREVSEALVEQMVNDESGLITIYYGSDVDEADANALHAALAEKYDLCDVEVHRGGQPLYWITLRRSCRNIQTVSSSSAWPTI